MATIADFLTGPRPKVGAAGGAVIGAAMEGMPELEPPTSVRLAAAAARVAPPIMAGVSGVGLPLIGLAGGGGEGLAQMIERAGGARDDFAPLAIPLQAGLSMIPVGKFAGARPLARTAVRAGQGAALGGAGAVGTELAEGRRPTVKDFLMGAGPGAVLGGIGGAVEARRLGRAPAPQIEAPPAGSPSSPVSSIGEIAGSGAPGLRMVPGSGSPKTRTKPLGPENLPGFTGKWEIFDQNSGEVRFVVDSEAAARRASERPGLDYGPQGVSDRDWISELTRRRGQDPTEIFSLDANGNVVRGTPLEAVDDAFTRLPGVAGDVPPTLPREAHRLERQVERVDELLPGLPEQNRNVVKAVMYENADELAAWAGQHVPVERTRKLGEELVLDLSRLKRTSGDVPMDQQIVALGNHVGFFTNRVAEAARRAVAEPDNPALKLGVKEAYADLVATIAGLTGRSAEAGRALRTLREIRTASAPLGGTNPRVIQKALRMGVDADRLIDLLSKIDPDDTLAQYRLLQGLRDPGARGYWRWYWYSSLLSRPRTHMRNVIGNNVNLAYKIASTPVSGAMERMAGVAPEDRTVLAGELGHQLHAWRTAMPEAWSKAMAVLKNGVSADDVANLELRPPEVFGGRMLPNLVGRALGAMDTFNRHVAAEIERHGTAYVDGWKASRGLEGPARTAKLADVMSERLAAPTKDMLKSMARFSARSTFQEDLPGWMDDMMRGRERMPPGIGAAFDFVMPFIRTPTNIVRQGVQASPLGLATELGRSTGRAGSQARGEAALATMLLAPVAWMAANGYVTGSGPSDPAEADALYKRGWRPNSFRIPQPDGRDVWIPYGQLQPIALPFATVANAFEASRAGEQVDPMLIGAKTARSVLQSSFLSGTMAFLEAVNDPERFLDKFMSQTARSLVPFSGAVSTIRELEDAATGNDYLREPKSTAEALGTALPTPLRDLLGLPDAPVRIRGTGEPARTSRNVAGILTGVDVGRSPEASPLDQELERLGSAGLMRPLSLPDRSLSIGGKRQPLSRTDEHTLREARGVAVREALEDLMASDGYQRDRDERRAERIRITVTRTRDMITRRASALYRQRGRQHLEEILPERLQP